MGTGTPNILSDEARWLARILRMQRMAIHSAITYPFSLTFTIGDGNPGTPLNGSDTYTNASLTSAIKVYKNGELLTEGSDYTHTSGEFTLVSPLTFDTNDVYIVLYQ